jgi:hypothetical protein
MKRKKKGKLKKGKKRRGKTRQGKARQDMTRQDKTRQRNTTQKSIRQHKTINKQNSSPDPSEPLKPSIQFTADKIHDPLTLTLTLILTHW